MSLYLIDGKEMSIEITGRITSYESLNRVLLNSNEIYKKVRAIRAPTHIHFITELSLTREDPGLSGVLYTTDGTLDKYLKERYGDDLLDRVKFGAALTADVSDYLDSAGYGVLSDFLPNCLPYWKGITDDGYYSNSGLMMLFDMNNYVPGSDGEKAVLIHYLILEFYRKEMDKPLDQNQPFNGGIEEWVADKINLFATLKHKPEIENVWLQASLEPSLTTTGKLIWHKGGTTIYGGETPHVAIYEADDAVVKAYSEDFAKSGKTEEVYWADTIRRIGYILNDVPYVRFDPKGMYDKINILDPKKPMLRKIYGKFTLYVELPTPAALTVTDLEMTDWLKRIAVMHALYNNPPKAQ